MGSSLGALRKYGIESSKKWYHHMLENVSTSTNGNFEILWDVEINGKVRHNRLHIIIKEKDRRKSYFVDVMEPQDYAVNMKEIEKGLQVSATDWESMN